MIRKIQKTTKQFLIFCFIVQKDIGHLNLEKVHLENFVMLIYSYSWTHPPSIYI